MTTARVVGWVDSLDLARSDYVTYKLLNTKAGVERVEQVHHYHRF